MAYKFQMGAAVLSGSLTQEGQVLAKDSVLSGSSLSIAGVAVTATAAELNLLDGVSGLVQGDLTKLAAVDSTAAELNIVDGDTAATPTTIADADRLILNDNGTMVQVAMTDFETYFEGALDTLSNVTTVGTLNAGSITSGFGSIDVGSSAITTTGTGSFGEVIVSGDLIVQGTTVTLDVATVGITGSFVFEGATANSFETTLGVVDPTADATINLPAMAAGTYYVPVLAADSTTAISATPAELNLLDGNASVGEAVGNLAGTDGVIINDGGTTKLLPLSDISTYIGSTGVRATGYVVRTISTGSATFQMSGFTGIYGFESDHTASMNIDLSGGAGGWSSGDLVIVKSDGNGATYPLTIRASGSGVTIDGETEIVLESPYAAVSLVYNGQSWMII